MGEEPMSIYKQMLAAGVPVDHHESDLYAKVTPESTAIVSAYKFRGIVTRFQSQIAGDGIWYEIPFAYDPAWEKLARRSS